MVPDAHLKHGHRLITGEEKKKQINSELLSNEEKCRAVVLMLLKLNNKGCHVR